jgi:hypothetical protein
MTIIFLFCWTSTGPAFADNWVKISGAENLRALVLGAEVEIQTKKGVVATRRYYDNGTAAIK